MKNIDLKVTGQLIANFIHRFHAIIFFLIVGLALMAALFITLPILSLSEEPVVSDSSKISNSFDEQTIKKIEDLRSRDENTTEALPDGRLNPFIE